VTEAPIEGVGEGTWTKLRRRKVVQWGLAYVAAGWGLLEGLAYVSTAFHWPEQLQRMAILAFAVGLPIALIIAWYHGDRGQQRVSGTEFTILTVLLLIGGALFWWFGRAPDIAAAAGAPTATQTTVEIAPDTSIVVLPFANLSADPEQEYFADGMAEEILNLLAKIPELRVISRNSAFAYKGKNAGLAEIAEQLKVTHVLEGSVRKSGDRIRITTQLIDASSDSHLWSETYDRTLDDVFEVQDDIAAKVVAQLELTLLGAVPKSRRVDPQAYLNYVQARHLLEQHEDAATIHRLLQRALEIDPGYAQAWTGLFWLYSECQTIIEDAEKQSLPLDQRDEFCSRTSVDEAGRLTRDALAKALELDPENATAIAYAALAAAWRGDRQSAADGFERAVRLDPTNADVLRPILHFTLAIRRPELTIRVGEFVVERDPGCSQCLDSLARAYEIAGRLDEAETTVRALGKQSSHILARILLQKGEAQAALDVVTAEGFVETEDDRAWALHLESMALHSLGRQAESAAALARLESEFGDRYAILIAVTCAWKRDMERSAVWLERSFEPANGGPNAIQLTIPILQPVLGYPRIRALLRQHGLAPEQLAEIKFELKLPGQR